MPPPPTEPAEATEPEPEPEPSLSPSLPPPASSFRIATGGFDFPRASPDLPPSSRPHGLARSRLLTDFLAQHQLRQQPARERTTTDRAPQRQPRVESLRRGGRAPRRAEQEQEQDHGSASASASASASGSTTAPAARPSATPSERYLRRGHARVRDARSVIEDPSTWSMDAVADGDSPRRQTKRRKTHHPPPPASEYDGFKYGYKGQVARGRLRMEVASCDGGQFGQDDSLYKVQNVLRNDKSVYCSAIGRCNLLLKHIGEMPFCLEKVVIRAPDRGFTAPVQEGLIFVSMSPDNLLSGTSAYHIRYNDPDHGPRPSSPTPSPPRDPEEQLISLQEAIQDPEVWERSRQAVTERIERMGLRTRHPGVQPIPLTRNQRDEQPNTDEDDGLNECPYHIEEGESSVAGVSAPTPPPFTTTTESDPEESDDNEALPSAAVMADRLRRESRYRSEDEDDEDGEDLIYRPFPSRRANALDTLDNFGERRWRSQRYDPIRAARLRNPSRIEPKHGQANSEHIIQPHARFFIARNKNKITIKFHPAISGKHVLLKLWSPTHDGNIDIESVQFYGYSGPRFFPAVKPC